MKSGKKGRKKMRIIMSTNYNDTRFGKEALKKKQGFLLSWAEDKKEIHRYDPDFLFMRD